MSDPSPKPPSKTNKNKSLIVRMLDFLEWSGNKLPDPAVLFLIGLFVTWGLSFWLSKMTFTEIKPGATDPVQVTNMLTLDNFADFLTTMVDEFAKFPPLGIVLVALLGVAVAEHSGFINACLKSLLDIAPKFLLTPMLILVAIISHTAADAGYVLVIPIGGVMFYAAGRHPLAGIACAFAGVSGGFSANFIVSGLDPLLSSLTQTGVDLVDKDYVVNPLCNIFFTAASCIFIVAVGWYLTDCVIEPRLQDTEIDGDPNEIPKFEELTSRDKLGMYLGLLSIVVSFGALAFWAMPKDSELRDDYGSLTAYVNSAADFGVTLAEDGKEIISVSGEGDASGLMAGDQLVEVREANDAGEFTATQFGDVYDYRIYTRDRNKTKPANFVVMRGGEEKIVTVKPAKAKTDGAPLMKMIVPLIFLIFVVPGLVHGYVSGKYKSHRDVIKGMSKTMETMGYYLVLVFFAALFIAAFKNSGIGDLLALKGANFIKESGAPPWVTIVCMIFLAASVNLLIGSASAKWAMLAPIFVPMLMYAGISPELTQAAYRIGDSTTNIITPMMPYFPLVVVFCQRYVKNSGIGTVGAMMLPYSVAFLITWTVVLLGYWALGLPLGMPDVPYEYVIESAGA
jgi:p-aminobenzoyl-glutamate transporter AbgT